MGCLSFKTRNRLKSCVRNQLPFCSLRIVFQSETTCLAYLNSKTVFPNTFAHILFRTFCVGAATQVTMMKLRDIFSYEGRTTWESLHWHRNRLKIPKSLHHNHIVLEGHNAVIMPHTMTFQFSFMKTLILNYTLSSHYWLREIDQNSTKTFSSIP